MNNQLQNALIFMIYGALLIGAVAAEHFGIVDPQLAGAMIGGTLAHMGVTYGPIQSKKNGSNGTPTNNKAA